VHRDILVNQTSQKLTDFGVGDCGFIKAGWEENRESLVQIASVQTLPKRDWWQHYPAGLIILDECHITAFSEVVKQMMNRVFPESLYLGLTATPWRLSKSEGMGDIFESLVTAPMPRDLIDAGFLIKPSYFSVRQADLEKVGTVAGEFNEAQLAVVCDRPELVKQIVKDWKRLAFGRRTIAFAVNVAHSKHLREEFQAAGVPAAHVDGTTPLKQRDQIYQQLADGEILVLTSCQALTEGFDVPAVNAILLCRPTMSRALHFQMIGRGLRLSPETDKRDCVIIDQAANILGRQHGPIEALTKISLDVGEEPQEGEFPMKICPTDNDGCGAIVHASLKQCPECGYVFPPPKKVFIVPGLTQFLTEEDYQRYQVYQKKLREAFHKNFSPGWAAQVFKEQYGHWPPDAWAKGAIFGQSFTLENQLKYFKYLQATAERMKKTDAWIKLFMILEFGFAKDVF